MSFTAKKKVLLDEQNKKVTIASYWIINGVLYTDVAHPDTKRATDGTEVLQ